MCWRATRTPKFGRSDVLVELDRGKFDLTMQRVDNVMQRDRVLDTRTLSPHPPPPALCNARPNGIEQQIAIVVGIYYIHFWIIG
jgi:hypothetical protein